MAPKASKICKYISNIPLILKLELTMSANNGPMNHGEKNTMGNHQVEKIQINLKTPEKTKMNLEEATQARKLQCFPDQQNQSNISISDSTVAPQSLGFLISTLKKNPPTREDINKTRRLSSLKKSNLNLVREIKYYKYINTEAGKK